MSKDILMSQMNWSNPDLSNTYFSYLNSGVIYTTSSLLKILNLTHKNHLLCFGVEQGLKLNNLWSLEKNETKIYWSGLTEFWNTYWATN